MKRIADKLIAVALFVVIAPGIVAACPLCRAQVESGVFNRDFFVNLFFVLLPVAILTAFGFGLYQAENLRRRWEKMR